MASLLDMPPEIVEKIIDNLEDDFSALTACSQTCLSLLPLCRKYIFNTVELPSAPDAWPADPRRLPQLLASLGHLLDTSPQIADYVRTLALNVHSSAFQYEDVTHTLGKFRRVQTLRLHGGVGVLSEWNTIIRPQFRESLAKIMQSDSLTDLEISTIADFPTSVFIPCQSLTHLTLVHVGNNSLQTDVQGIYIPDKVARLQSFSFQRLSGRYLERLVKAKRPNDLPILDFSTIRRLSIEIDDPLSLGGVHELLKVQEKLEVLEYTVDDLIDGFKGLGSSMSPSSWSTLKRVSFDFDINNAAQDPLCGLCEEFEDFAKTNVIEEITLRAQVQTNCECSTGDEWGRLDKVITDGFSNLRIVSLSIDIWVFGWSPSAGRLEEKLKKLPQEQFPRLSENDAVTFHFSTEVHSI